MRCERELLRWWTTIIGYFRRGNGGQLSIVDGFSPARY
jgi:hypothetical protein